ncbi:RDD family protein [Lysobacter olei]
MTSHPNPTRALVGWRLLALLYDFFPALAIWMLLGALFNAAHYLSGHAAREYIHPYSAWAWALWACCWVATGAYAVLSWRRGGQTLGMRPWRLQVVAVDGGPATLRALRIRYTVGTLSVLAAGLGFWWAWFDRDRLTWHDRISGTRLVRHLKSN